MQESTKDPQFYMDVITCFNNYFMMETLRDELLHMDSYKWFNKGIQSTCMPMKQNTCDFIVECCKYQEFADMFVEMKVFDNLLKELDDPCAAAIVSPAIEAILQRNLPVKFALCGRLELTDITENVFYATHKIWTHPRCLHQIFMSNQCASRRPIVTCCFENSKSYSISMVSLSSRMEPGNSSMEHKESFSHRPIDQRLPMYLKAVNESLQVITL